MMIKKLKQSSYLYMVTMVCLLIGIMSAISILDSYNFLNKLNLIKQKISVQDIIIYIIYGINNISGASFIDIIRFSIPYILLILFVGAYLSNILEDSGKYLHLIRYKYYKTWLRKNYINLLSSVFLILSTYYISLILISLLFIKDCSGFTDTFLMLNPFYHNTNNFIELLFYQYLISLSLGIVIMSLQLLLTIIYKNADLGFIIMGSLVLLFTSLGRWDIYNPFMICKHSIMNSNYKIHPLVTISLSITLAAVIYVLLVKILKYVVRRRGI